MNFSIVIVTHGEWAGKLVQAAESIAGKQEGIVSINLSFNESPELFEEKLFRTVKELGGIENILFLVDLKGGTPWNTVIKLKQHGRVKCVAGLNLPMLLEVMISRDADAALADTARAAVETGRLGVIDLDSLINNL